MSRIELERADRYEYLQRRALRLAQQTFLLMYAQVAATIAFMALYAIMRFGSNSCYYDLPESALGSHEAPFIYGTIALVLYIFEGLVLQATLRLRIDGRLSILRDSVDLLSHHGRVLAAMTSVGATVVSFVFFRVEGVDCAL